MSPCLFEDYKPEKEWFCPIYALYVGHVESPCPYPQLFENQWTSFTDMEHVKPYIPNPHETDAPEVSEESLRRHEPPLNLLRCRACACM